ncbi:hypothetical protein F5X99DRAFT_79448 [Biscogniauxia marginata]|nr:hypothetical protein F5X99DRAFT_79448 [Biscogniauxia marginata]
MSGSGNSRFRIRQLLGVDCLGPQVLVTKVLSCRLPNFIHLILEILLEFMLADDRGVYRDGFEVYELGYRDVVYEVEKLPQVLCLDVDGLFDLCQWIF